MHIYGTHTGSASRGLAGAPEAHWACSLLKFTNPELVQLGEICDGHLATLHTYPPWPVTSNRAFLLKSIQTNPILEALRPRCCHILWQRVPQSNQIPGNEMFSLVCSNSPNFSFSQQEQEFSELCSESRNWSRMYQIPRMWPPEMKLVRGDADSHYENHLFKRYYLLLHFFLHSYIQYYSHIIYFTVLHNYLHILS